MLNIPEMQELRDLLSEVKTIAVVGLSPKEARPSNMVARYLIEAGYTVIPVNPGKTNILERTCYSSLDEIPITVDLVDIFRRSEEVYPIVESAVKIGVKAVWMQQGIVNSEAADYARTQGLKVVMDRCIKIDHQSLLVEPS